MSQRVLLVEAERDTREQLGRALESWGYVCALAESASAALAQLERLGSVDAIVTDLTLGAHEQHGPRLLSELRRSGLRVPIVVTTSGADLQKVKFALNEGADHLLEKPFQPAELVAAIERVLAHAQPRYTPERLFEHARLTQKERTVARHMLEGRSSQEIAELENNSPKTIRQHVSSIYAKCQVGSRAEFLHAVYRHYPLRVSAGP